MQAKMGRTAVGGAAAGPRCLARAARGPARRAPMPPAAVATRGGARRWRAPSPEPPAPAEAPPPARDGGVFVRMEGQPLLELAAGHRAVPLLAPESSRVPFAMALRIIEPGAAPSQILGAGAAGPDTVELHYVLGGSGELLGARHTSHPVSAGDTIMAPQGAAMFAAPAGATRANGSGAPAPLVMLQVLLPGRLLRDAAAGQRTAFTDPAELGLRPEWLAPQVVKAGRLTQEIMCGLLSPEAAHLAHSDARAAVASAAAAAAAAGDGPYGAEVSVDGYTGEAPVVKRSLAGVRAWRMPNATNQLALMFGPHTDPGLSMTFGVEMFEPGHRTNRHTHSAAYEMFIVLGGTGVAIDGDNEVPIRSGDIAVFPPHVVHAVDNPTDRRLWCLQMMLPNEMFAEYVTSGALQGPLDSHDMAGAVTGSC